MADIFFRSTLVAIKKEKRYNKKNGGGCRQRARVCLLEVGGGEEKKSPASTEKLSRQKKKKSAETKPQTKKKRGKGSTLHGKPFSGQRGWPLAKMNAKKNPLPNFQTARDVAARRPRWQGKGRKMRRAGNGRGPCNALESFWTRE